MKTFPFYISILIYSFFFIPNILLSQQTWVTDNARWTYNYNGPAEEGYIIVEEVLEINIQGNLTKGYEQKVFKHTINPQGELILSSIYVIDTTYIYFNNDTVNMYYDDSFVPIYILNSSDNNNYVSIANSENVNCSISSNIEVNDSNSVILDGQEFRSYLLLSDNSNSFKINGKINSRFGHYDSDWNKYNFIFPKESICDIGLDDSFSYQFRCFEDDDFSYGIGDCIFPYNSLNLFEENSESQTPIVQNPVLDGYLRFYSNSLNYSKVLLVSSQGKVLIESFIDKSIESLDVSYLECGIYTLILNSKNQVFSQKIVINK